MKRRSDTMNVPVRVRIFKPGGPLGNYEARASTRVTPWGRIEISAFDFDPHVARRLAQAALLDSLARVIRQHYGRAP